MPKERRKGYLQPLIFSGVILVASGICLVLDVWVVFNNLFKAGPTGISYIEAYRNDSAGNSSHNVVMILSSVTGDVTIAAGDILLFGAAGDGLSSSPPLPARGVSVISRIVCLVMMSKRSYIVEGLVAVVSMTAESLSVSTNVAVTGLIVFRLAGASRRASRLCPSMKRSGTYSNVAAMIIESAAPLAIFGICYIIVTAIAYYHYPETLSQQGRVNTLSEVSGSLYVAFSALSPQMIIYRVLNGQSWKNAHESNELTESFLQHFGSQHHVLPHQTMMTRRGVNLLQNDKL
ncbi:hypothetical protein BKA70DRAFT_1535717 [Coprinopsis sp. MPI-PUGE-AT-0042]|nr:hypothetical protein BKA70DRAFT_1535717 [Coprinopsis sp. MPI-PUGE-AT-0042]